MLDMGFLPEIRRIISQLPKRPRQTFFFSATMPNAIVKLADEMLDRPAKISVERRQAPAEGVEQALYPVAQQAKVSLLVEMLRRDLIGDAIIFCRTKHRANRVFQKLERQGVPAARIHGNRSQSQRTKALAGFKDGRYRVIVATDILARGIDVEDLDHVVNFDVPATPEDYIHRVGRTGRAEATGDAFTFVAPEENDLVRAIERKLGAGIERRTLDGFDYEPGSTEPLEVPLEQRLKKMRAERGQSGRRNGDHGNTGSRGGSRRRRSRRG